MKDISQAEIDMLRKNMQKQRIEYLHLEEKVKEYKKRIKSGSFQLAIEWETDITAINLDNLKTPLIDEIKNNIPFDYKIVELDLDKVVECHCEKSDKIFPKDNLWVIRQPHTMARLIDFVEGGNKIIPPLIEANGDKILIIDGNHRIALCRYLKIEKIPFLISKNSFSLLKF
ncbi:hypothetical protein LJB98_01065 [Bacteroidales bacterium OttesenSCG-928-M11]|nr:hypothetical protein [Bacteroidales bacterium OttesenSCG-928-M11]